MNIELKSIQIGEVSLIEPSESADWRFSPMTSGIRKSSVDRTLYLARNGFKGDEQSDLRVHGGPDKAVCVCLGTLRRLGIRIGSEINVPGCVW